MSELQWVRPLKAEDIPEGKYAVWNATNDEWEYEDLSTLSKKDETGTSTELPA